MHRTIRRPRLVLAVVGALGGVATAHAQPSPRGLSLTTVRPSRDTAPVEAFTTSAAPVETSTTSAAPDAGSSFVAVYPPRAVAITAPPAARDDPRWRRPPAAVPPITPPYGPDALRERERLQLVGAILGAGALLYLLYGMGHQ